MYKGFKLNANGCIAISNDEIGGNYHSSYEKAKSFEEYAKEELSELTPDEKNEKFVTIYRSAGYTYHALSTKSILKLALTGQDFICNAMIKRIISCTKCGVYYKEGNKYHELWNIGLLRQEKNSIFLKPEKLEKTLKKVFSNFELTLGELREKNTSSIAWKIDASEGVYYIIWHNGCICKDDTDLSFIPKSIKELRRTYKTLSFAVSHDNNKEYKILFA